MHEYDNRYLWMNLKRIIGSHFANYRESWEANRLIAKGMIHPTLSQTYPLEEAGQAALDVHRNPHQGKVGVLCLAPEEGLGRARRRAAGQAPRRDQPLPGRLSQRHAYRVARRCGPADVGCASRSRADTTGATPHDDEPRTTVEPTLGAHRIEPSNRLATPSRHATEQHERAQPR